MNKRNPWLLFAISVAVGLAVWWVVTDARVKTWPESVRSIYARGAIQDYLELRCLAPTTVELARRSGDLKIADTYVDAYTTQAEDVSIWNIGAGGVTYPVMVSIFPDGEYAVTWWYQADNPSAADSYVSSKAWDSSESTQRKPIESHIAEASGIPVREKCGGESTGS